MVWRGVIIKESLEDNSLLDLVKIVGTKKNIKKFKPSKTNFMLQVKATPVTFWKQKTVKMIGGPTPVIV